jgi:hypothetical protein
MPEDVRTDVELEDDEETVEVVHDDIVKRLLDYQRKLRDDDASATRVIVLPEAALETPLEDASASGDSSLRRRDDAASTNDASLTDAADVAALHRTETTVAAAAEESDPMADRIVIVELEPGVTDPATAQGDADVSVGTSDAPAAASSVTASDGSTFEREAFLERSADDEGRIGRMEIALDRLAGRFSELRASFADMAIAADERLAEIEDLLTDVRRRS